MYVTILEGMYQGRTIPDIREFDGSGYCTRVGARRVSSSR